MDTYVVLHKPIVRHTPGEDPEVFNVGDPIVPTEQELNAFRDKLRKADNFDRSAMSAPPSTVPDVPQRGMMHPPALNEDGTLPGEVSTESEEREFTRRRGRPPRVREEESESDGGGSPSPLTQT
jgi:hypothetical protein